MENGYTCKCPAVQVLTNITVRINWLKTRTFISPTALYIQNDIVCKARNPCLWSSRELIHFLVSSVTDFILFSEVLYACIQIMMILARCCHEEWLSLDVSRAKVEWNSSDRLLRWSLPCQSVEGSTLGEINGVELRSFQRILISWLHYKLSLVI